MVIMCIVQNDMPQIKFCGIFLGNKKILEVFGSGKE
jgi:hypothetical protein